MKDVYSIKLDCGGSRQKSHEDVFYANMRNNMFMTRIAI